MNPKMNCDCYSEGNAIAEAPQRVCEMAKEIYDRAVALRTVSQNIGTTINGINPNTSPEPSSPQCLWDELCQIKGVLIEVSEIIVNIRGSL